MNRFYSIVAVTLALGLAACSEEKSEVTETPPALEKESKASTASVPTGEGRVSTDAAAQACVGHASNQFGVSMSAFRVISSLGSSEGTGVEIVATDGRQGRCFVGPTGEVINFEASGGDTARAPSGAAGAATNSDGTDMEASSAYDQGCAAGTEDANNNMSMAYERHSGEYESQYEDTFRAGFEKCWMENRQETQQVPPPEANNAATNSDGTDMEASSAYDQGCAAGTEDANNNMSMAYERHGGEYDSQYEDTFRAGFEKCWMQIRQ